MRNRRLAFLPNIKVEHKRHLLALGILIVAVLIAFPSLYVSGAPGFDDLSRLNVPQRMLVGWFYRHGQFPFWNPFSFGGQPLWSAGQSGPFYLPNLVFVWLPVVAAVKASYLFHELLAAVGMYVAVWHIGKSRVGAVVSAIAFTTCGFMLGHQIHTQMYDAMSWLPLVFWLLLRLLDGVTPWRICALSGALAMEVYAGHPQVTFYLFLMVFLYLLLHLLQNVRQKQARRSAIAVVLSMVLGMLLSAAQWLPTLEFISYSSRSATSAFFLLQGSMSPAGTAQLLSPFVLGGGYTGTQITQSTSISFYHNVLFWEFTGYVGIIVLTLAGAAVLHAWRKNEAVRNLFIIGILSLNLSLGDNGLLASVLVHIPGFDLFRIPARYIGITDFCVAGLAGISVGYLIRDNTRMRIRLQRWIGVCASICALILLVLKGIGPLHDTPSLSFWVPFGLCLLIVWLSFHRITNARWFYSAYISTLAILDCVTQSGAFSTFVVVSTPEYNHPSPVVSYLQNHMDASDPFARVVAFGDTTISYDKPDAFRIPSLNGYDSLEPQWYANHIDLTWSTGTLMQQPRAVLDAMDVQYVVTPRDSDTLPKQTLGIQSWMHWIPSLPNSCDGLLIRFSSTGDPLAGSTPLSSVTLVSGTHHYVQYIPSLQPEVFLELPVGWPKDTATQIRIDNQSWFTAFKVQDVEYLNGFAPIQGNKLAVNQWFGPKGWSRVFSDAHESIWQNPDTLHSAWLTTSAETPLLATENSTLHNDAWSPNTQTWSVQNRQPEYLILPQTYDPGWLVQIDGKAAQVTDVGKGIGDILTGVHLPAGKHTVVFRYRPKGIVLGVALSLGGGCLWLVLLALHGRNSGRTRRKKR